MQATDTPAAAPAVAPVDVDELTRKLAAPFAAGEVKFKPAVVSGNRALALAYIDARVIQDRLDEVLGVAGWQDEYECLPDGAVVCKLHLRLGEQWVTKVDVGGQSEQPDEGDRRKAAFSDALKRAAVKFGIGRYLYRLPSQWVDYDPHKRQFARMPSLPEPLPRASRPTTQKAERGAGSGKEPQPAPPVPGGPGASKPVTGLPANGAELQRRLYDKDALLAKKGLCSPGDLVKHVVQAGVQAGFDADLAAWSGPAILLAAEEVKAFEVRPRPAGAGPRKEVA